MITDEHLSGEGAPASEPIDPAIVAAFAGRYLLEDDRELSLQADGSTLKIQLIQGMDGVPMVHLGDGRFLFPPARWEVSLDLDSTHGQRIVVHLVEGAIFRGEPRDVEGRRADVRPLTQDDRRAYVGDYASPELGVIYRVLLDGDTLILEHPRLGRMPLTFHSGDAFGLPGQRLRRLVFRRSDPDDTGSAIEGLTAEAYAWGVTTAFDRLAP